MNSVKSYGVKELMEFVPEMGPWKLTADIDGLVHESNGYFIPFAECKTSAQVLDWVMQVSGKVWCDDATLGGLVRAIEYHLDPQANLCSNGIERGPMTWTPDNVSRDA